MNAGIIAICVFLFLVGASFRPADAQETIDLSDVGKVYLENSGSAAAQQSFLHGLAQLHNFEYELAALDFQEAQRIDPAFALAYWGEAMTHTHPIWMEQDRDAALEILNRYAPTAAARQDRAPTELARDLFAAADILYGDGTKQDRDDRYMTHMGILFEKYPDNAEVASLYALSIMGTAHEGRDIELYLQSAVLMEEFITDYPEHPGVAHYLIHATDDPEHASRGLHAADNYATIAPNAGHAQHMTTHIYLALGDWDGVIRANERAVEISDTLRAEQGLGPSGCGHYNAWLMYGYLQKGQRVKANEIMTLCYQNIYEGKSTAAESFVWQRMLYLLDTGDWNGDVAAMEISFNDNLNAEFENQILDGWIGLNTENITRAHNAYMEAADLLELLNDQWDRDNVPAAQASRITPLISLRQLEAKINLAMGFADIALDELEDAVELELEMPFGFGPPSPAKPSLELLGETLLSMGLYNQAIETLEVALERTPNKALTVRAHAQATAASENPN